MTNSTSLYIYSISSPMQSTTSSILIGIYQHKCKAIDWDFGRRKQPVAMENHELLFGVLSKILAFQDYEVSHARKIINPEQT